MACEPIFLRERYETEEEYDKAYASCTQIGEWSNSKATQLLLDGLAPGDMEGHRRIFKNVYMHFVLGIPKACRNRGVHIVAARGSGKSRLLGRWLAYWDFTDVPTVVFDNGDTIDNFLDRSIRGYKDEYDEVSQNIRYVDVGSQTHITPFPFYHRLGAESPYEIASRLPELFRRMDPALETASIQGYNAIVASLIPAGMKLVENGWQITELQAVTDEIPPSLQSKLMPFLYDPATRAMYGASMPGIDWQEVVDKKQIVLLDFRNCRTPETLRLASHWILRSLLEFIQYRGAGQSPISIIIDELANFVASQGVSQDVFAQDLDTLINTIMRRHNVWLTVAHQEMTQFSEKIQSLLIGMDTHIIGRAGDLNTAVKLAYQFFPADPNAVKRTEDVYDSYEVWVTALRTRRQNDVIDQRIIDDPLSEQHYRNGQKIRTLEQFDFFYQHPSTLPPTQFYVSGDGFNEFLTYYPDKDAIARHRQELLVRHARPIADILAEISRRAQKPPAKPAPNQGKTGDDPKKINITGKKL